jgi:hypothetical protein
VGKGKGKTEAGHRAGSNCLHLQPGHLLCVLLGADVDKYLANAVDLTFYAACGSTWPLGED